MTFFQSILSLRKSHIILLNEAIYEVFDASETFSKFTQLFSYHVHIYLTYETTFIKVAECRRVYLPGIDSLSIYSWVVNVYSLVGMPFPLTECTVVSRTSDFIVLTLPLTCFIDPTCFRTVVVVVFVVVVDDPDDVRPAIGLRG